MWVDKNIRTYCNYYSLKIGLLLTQWPYCTFRHNQSFFSSEEKALDSSSQDNGSSIVDELIEVDDEDANTASIAKPIELDGEELAICPWNNCANFTWRSYNLASDCIRNWILNHTKRFGIKLLMEPYLMVRGRGLPFHLPLLLDLLEISCWFLLDISHQRSDWLFSLKVPSWILEATWRAAYELLFSCSYSILSFWQDSCTRVCLWLNTLPSRNFGILLKFMKWPLNPSWIPGNAWRCAGYFRLNFRRLPVWISDDCQGRSAKPQLNSRSIDFLLIS